VISRLPPTIRLSLAATAIVLGGLVAACGGDGGDERSVELDQLTSIAGAEQVEGTRLNEEIIEDEARRWEAELEDNYSAGWEGGYRAQYTDVEGDIVRVEVSIDLYDSVEKAEERASVERRLNDDFLSDSLSASVVVEEFEEETGIDSCAALSIKHPAIVPQFEVYCHEGATVIFAKAISTNEDNAIALATRLAGEITKAMQEASSTESS
jgi:hypothetical protein